MTALLILHIVTAIAAVAASIISLVAAWRGSSMTAASTKAMWGSFGATGATGVALVFVSPQTLAHTCVLMTAYAIMMIGVQVYARSKTTLRA